MQFGRVLIVAGLILIVVGIAVIGLTRLNLPLGRLPGDLVWRGKKTVVYFPWVTCLVLSGLGTLLMWLLRRR